jgi:hypothetical protein
VNGSPRERDWTTFRHLSCAGAWSCWPAGSLRTGVTGCSGNVLSCQESGNMGRYSTRSGAQGKRPKPTTCPSRRQYLHLKHRRVIRGSSAHHRSIPRPRGNKDASWARDLGERLARSTVVEAGAGFAGRKGLIHCNALRAREFGEGAEQLARGERLLQRCCGSGIVQPGGRDRCHEA